MPEIPLTFCGFLDEFERIFAGDTDFVGDVFAGFLRDSFDMRDDTVDVLAGVGAVVVGLEKDDMCAGFAGEVGADLGFVGLFFEHGDGYEQAMQRLDSHRIGDEDIGPTLLAAVVEMALNNARVIRTFNQFNIVVVVPNHFLQEKNINKPF